MTAILRLQLDDKDPVRVNSAINQLAESYDRNARSKLTAATTFYVSTSGSNSNSGSQSSPFLTIQHAYDFIANNIDLGGQSITILCASGTYTTGLVISTPWSGGGSITLDLGGGTINSSNSCLNIQCSLPSPFTIKNGTVTCSGASSINNGGSGSIVIGVGMIFGACGGGGAHMASVGSASGILCFQPYAITGGAQFHYFAFLSGNFIRGNNVIVTITGTPAITNFAYSSRLGLIDIEVFVFSGGTTGTRYFVDSNAVIFTAGGGANYFPGTIAGPATPTPTGGQYI